MTFPLQISALSLLTPLDDATHTTWSAIQAERRVLDRGLITAPLNADEYATGESQLDRSTLLALTVVADAMEQSRWAKETVRDAGTGLFVGTSKGPILSWMAALDVLREGGALAGGLARQVALGPHAMAAALQEKLGLRGQAHTAVAACSSGLHALHRAAKAIWQGDCQRAIVVAADASVHPMFEHSFARLGVLAGRGGDGHRRCEPFHPDGPGFIISEAAAALVIEPVDPKGEARVQITNTWIGSDASHLLALDADARALRGGLRNMYDNGRMAGERGPAFIHAHATGTAHDVHELAAVRSVFPDARSSRLHERTTEAEPTANSEGPVVFSAKKFLGHSLGAAGLLSLGLSALCHRHGLGLDGTPLPAKARSLTIAQGFGGHIAVVGLQDSRGRQKGHDPI